MVSPNKCSWIYHISSIYHSIDDDDLHNDDNNAIYFHTCTSSSEEGYSMNIVPWTINIFRIEATGMQNSLPHVVM